MSDLLLLLAAIAPGIAICLYIMFHDRTHPEPLKLLIGCFVFGMLSTIPAIFLEGWGMDYFGVGGSEAIVDTLIFAFGVIGFSEEFSKFVFLRLYAYPKRAFDEPLDGIVYSVMVSMGFAVLENILYVYVRGGGYSTAWARMFTAVPAHGAFAVMMGYYMGLAKFSGRKATLLMFWGLLLASFVHGAYDFFIFQKAYDYLTILTFLTLAIALVYSVRLISRHKRHIARRTHA